MPVKKLFKSYINCIFQRLYTVCLFSHKFSVKVYNLGHRNICKSFNLMLTNAVKRGIIVEYVECKIKK